jgi:hypothetical protein
MAVQATRCVRQQAHGGALGDTDRKAAHCHGEQDGTGLRSRAKSRTRRSIQGQHGRGHGLDGARRSAGDGGLGRHAGPDRPHRDRYTGGKPDGSVRRIALRLCRRHRARPAEWRAGVPSLCALTDCPKPDSSPLRELITRRLPHVWLTLAIGAIGFGGMLAGYNYFAATLLSATHVVPAVMLAVLCLFGIGMTIGNLLASWAADRALMPTDGVRLLWATTTLALLPLAA